MKELFTAPEAEIIVFAEQDIVTTSGPSRDDGTELPDIPLP